MNVCAAWLVQMELYAHVHARQPATHASCAACTHAHRPTTCAARFWIGHDLTVGWGPGAGDPCFKGFGLKRETNQYYFQCGFNQFTCFKRSSVCFSWTIVPQNTEQTFLHILKETWLGFFSPVIREAPEVRMSDFTELLQTLFFVLKYFVASSSQPYLLFLPDLFWANIMIIKQALLPSDSLLDYNLSLQHILNFNHLYPKSIYFRISSELSWNYF